MKMLLSESQTTYIFAHLGHLDAIGEHLTTPENDPKNSKGYPLEIFRLTSGSPHFSRPPAKRSFAFS